MRRRHSVESKSRRHKPPAEWNAVADPLLIQPEQHQRGRGQQRKQIAIERPGEVNPIQQKEKIANMERRRHQQHLHRSAAVDFRVGS